MVDSNHKFRTDDTPLAAYLMSEGFQLLLIEYEPVPNRVRDRGVFVFDSHDPKLPEAVSCYNRGAATINLAVYEHIRQKLIERIMGRLP